jgi:hypothetical protein
MAWHTGPRLWLAVGLIIIIVGLVACRPTQETQPMIDVTLDKTGDSAEVIVEDGRAVINVRSERGIGGLRAELTAGTWPAAVAVRLHNMKGLERLEIGFDDYLVTSSVSSTSQPAPLPTVYTISELNEAKVMTDAGRDFYPTIDIVPTDGAQAAIPLEGGYFEIGLPPNFYLGRPDAFTMQWIDFYR